MSESIMQYAQSLLPEMIEMRRDFHRHPEIGFQEHRTSKIVADRLKKLGYEVQAGVAETGVVGLLRGSKPDGPTLAIRAEMDALPLQEETDHDFRSQNDGFMHACAHDGHMAIALGLAKWIIERPEPFPGNVKLIFQPGEEGYGGAKKMIQDGVLEDPKVDALLGLHLWNGVPIGLVGVVSGPCLASIDSFVIDVIGKGGHAAMPHQTVDSVLVAAQILVALQSIVSRNIDPFQPAVISATRILADTADNAIAEKATLRGTARAYDAEVRKRFPELIERYARGVAQGMGATIDLTWNELYPPTVTHPRIAELVRAAASDVLEQEVPIVQERSMASDDIAFFLEKVPGCFIFLGSANPEKGLDKPLHNRAFDFDESVMPLGMSIFARAAERFFGID